MDHILVENKPDIASVTNSSSELANKTVLLSDLEKVEKNQIIQTQRRSSTRNRRTIVKTLVSDTEQEDLLEDEKGSEYDSDKDPAYEPGIRKKLNDDGSNDNEGAAPDGKRKNRKTTGNVKKMKTYVWTEADEKALVLLYKNATILYNPNFKNHLNPTVRHKAMEIMGNELGIPAVEVEEKIENLTEEFMKTRDRNHPFNFLELYLPSTSKEPVKIDDEDDDIIVVKSKHGNSQDGVCSNSSPVPHVINKSISERDATKDICMYGQSRTATNAIDKPIEIVPSAPIEVAPNAPIEVVPETADSSFQPTIENIQALGSEEPEFQDDIESTSRTQTKDKKEKQKVQNDMDILSPDFNVEQEVSSIENIKIVNVTSNNASFNEQCASEKKKVNEIGDLLARPMSHSFAHTSHADLEDPEFLFGLHVRAELKMIPSIKARRLAKLRIQNILYEAQTGFDITLMKSCSCSCCNENT